MATVKTNTDVFEKAWEGFKGTDWKEKASVSRFVQANYTPYDGDESFLAGPTERSLKIKKIVDETKAGLQLTMVSSVLTLQTSVVHVTLTQLLVFQMLTHGDVSSGFTLVLPFTVLTT